MVFHRAWRPSDGFSRVRTTLTRPAETSLEDSELVVGGVQEFADDGYDLAGAVHEEQVAAAMDDMQAVVRYQQGHQSRVDRRDDRIVVAGQDQGQLPALGMTEILVRRLSSDHAILHCSIGWISRNRKRVRWVIFSHGFAPL